MKRLKTILAGALIAVFGAVAVLPAVPAVALDPLAICDDPANAANEVCKNRGDNANDLIGVLVNTLLFIVGTLSVVMVIYGGIRYTTSAGNTNAVTSAKNTIIYAIVGLVVSFIAFAVINWVLRLFQ